MYSIAMDHSGHDLGVTFLDLDDLSDEDQFIKEQVHKIAFEVVRPASVQLDRMAPGERILEGSPYYAVMNRLKSLGYHKLFLPPEYGGGEGEVTPITLAVVLEELGWGSLGLATSFLVDMMPFLTIAYFGNDDLKEKYLKPWIDDEVGAYHGCWAITEPDHGSDYLTVRGQKEKYSPKGQLIATQANSGWILTGQKSAWVSSGPVATHAAVHAQAGADGDLHHSFFAIVDLSSEGVRKGKVQDMLGVKDDPQGEIFFDEVFVPAENILVAPSPIYPVFGDQLLCVTSASIANVAVGLARAAFEEALNHSRTRMQGGGPISDHKNIKLTLYSMFEKIETARAYARKANYHVRNHALLGFQGGSTGASPRHTRTAQIYAKRIAFEVAHDAIQVLGAFGLSRESIAEKLFRDARCLLIEDGTLEILAFDAVGDVLSNYENSSYQLEEVMAQW